MAVLRQTWTLTSKNLRIVLLRHSVATVVRAFVIPVVIIAVLAFAQNLFVPPAQFGISPARAVRSLANGLAESTDSGRTTVAFVNSGFTGGDIEAVIDELATVVRGGGKKAVVLESEAELPLVCRASLRGVTPCYGAVVFYSSPDEGNGGIWNYTLRNDGSLGGGRIDVDKDSNDGQVYLLPLQHAVDVAITERSYGGDSNDGQGSVVPETVDEYPYTSLTQEERAERIRNMFQDIIHNAFGVIFIISVIGVAYHLTGFMAQERETGMSTLIEAMMTTKRRWQAQAARLLSYHLAFSLVYAPGWVVAAIIIWRGVFPTTNGGIVIIFHILAGLALSSMSIFGASLFKKAQLSGVSITIIYIVLAVIAQILTAPKTGTVAVLSFLFMPCNYVYFIHFMARWEKQQEPSDLSKSPPLSSWEIPGIVLWVFLIVQIIVYPILGALIERYLHGTTSSTRNIVSGQDRGDLNQEDAVFLDGFTKIYKPGPIRRLFSFISKPKEPVVAVNGLTLTARRGQILALLGANGSGKSTTLDTIAGINKLTSGNITIDGTGGIGIAPQKNVLWDELTVEEHVRIFNKLKSPLNLDSKEQTRALIESVDLALKIKAQSKTLSGGQKRKLQLGMMLTGGSAVCCVDEVSSGIDPLSRRKIWDILLAERGRRTMILTTHFLDEADLLADHIAVLSKGTLRAEGSSVELKDRMGGGYRIHLNNAKQVAAANGGSTPDIPGVTKKASYEEVVYVANTSSLAATVIKELESKGISDYRFSGPTIEDVFLQLAEEVRSEEGVVDGLQGDAGDVMPPHSRGGLVNNQHQLSSSNENVNVNTSGKNASGLQLMSGRRIGYLRQTGVLFLKRCVIFKGNWFPTVAAFVIPIVAAGLVTLFVKDQAPVGCNPAQQSSRRTAVNLLSSDFDLTMVAGPSDKFSIANLARLFAPIVSASLSQNSTGTGGSDLGSAASNLLRNITVVDTFDEFSRMVVDKRKDITPAGIWLGDDNSVPTVAYKANGAEIFNAWFGQWIMDMMLSNSTIASSMVYFDIPFAPDAGDALQMLVYIGLALCAYPAFFSLYPNLERRRNVRGLQYSNGVQPLPLWLAYTAFDFAIAIVATAIVTALFAGLASVWWHIGYIFLVFTFYGLASILLSYVISLWSANQLSAYAFTAAGQVVFFLIYLIAYMSVITYVDVDKIDSNLLVVHFVVSAFAPIGSATRAIFLALNLFSTSCDGNELSQNPGGIKYYGGPILYLILQSLFLFGILVWFDAGNVGGSFKRLFYRLRSNKSAPDAAATRDEAAAVSDEEVAIELVRVKSSATGTNASEKGGAGQTGTSSHTDGLRVVNLTKTFGKNTAVDNVTFGIPHGEVFALLGPNGAGKSTTISVIRGDLKPSGGARGGDVFVEQASVTRDLANARLNLGVCPQFDCVDQMTVLEHLRFYARVRGIPDIDYNVEAILSAVGLSAFRDRQAHALSGGNKRKLSLGIALMGNPSVILLDEPSSGLDAAAKRIMWRTLAATVPGRSILLTTHSMEEADALAGRAGILAKRMLAMGTVDQLRRRFGDTLHVHLVCRGAPRTTDGEVEKVRKWVQSRFPGADVEEKTYHGQMRFSVPAGEIVGGGGSGDVKKVGDEINGGARASSSSASTSAIGKLVVMLEESKQALGIEHYSVSPTTLDQVFLTVVGRHNVKEEGYADEEDKKKGKKGKK